MKHPVLCAQRTKNSWLPKITVRSPVSRLFLCTHPCLSYLTTFACCVDSCDLKGQVEE